MAIDLDELERLAAQATPGPWRVKCDNEICAGEKKVHLARVMLSYKEWEVNAAYIVAACNSLPGLITENRALQERVRELERQRDFLLMRGKTPACLLCVDCSYLVGEPCNWGCTAKLEIRKKCLEKAVARRAEGTTGKTADMDAEQASREAGE